MKSCCITGEMTVAVVEWSCANVYVTHYDDFSALGNQFVDAFLQHKVVIHFERKTGIRCFVRTVNVDKDEQAKI